MEKDAFIILDPVNATNAKLAVQNNIKTFVGGNCSITLAMIGIAGLLKQDLVEWLNVITFQAASGAGAQNVKELLLQNNILANNIVQDLQNDKLAIIDIMQSADQILKSDVLPIDNFGVPLISNIIPWIDSDLGNGSSREEWKGEVELNKILGFPEGHIKVDGFCVRVGAIRCHSTAITMKLKQNLTLQQIEQIITQNQPWVNLIANNKVDTLKSFTPIAVSGSLQVHVGRLKEINFGDNIFGLMTIGDQLLWGAAEPLRRVLNLLLTDQFT
jgi:aspartate-semialdehyde dehydrogenase